MNSGIGASAHTLHHARKVRSIEIDLIPANDYIHSSCSPTQLLGLLLNLTR